MAEQVLPKKSVFDFAPTDRINMSDVYSPTYGHIQAILHVIKGEQVPERVRDAVVDFAMRQKEDLAAVMDTWNRTVKDFPGQVKILSKITLMSLPGFITLSYGEPNLEAVELRQIQLNLQLMAFGNSLLTY